MGWMGTQYTYCADDMYSTTPFTVRCSHLRAEQYHTQATSGSYMSQPGNIYFSLNITNTSFFTLKYMDQLLLV